ncbi:MAG: RadC family protein [Akkermansiaceae bacterium]
MSDHLRIHDLPDDERPREKMLRHGPSALSDAELLAIFLRTGTKGQSAIEIGRNLIAKHGSLSALGSLDVKGLSREHGLGLAKSCQLMAAFEMGARSAREAIKKIPLNSPYAIYQHLAPLLGHLAVEHLYVLTLDTRHYLKRMVPITSGTTNQTVAHARDILEPVIIDRADGFIVAHNHPSGNVTPSAADDHITIRLKRLARSLDVTFVDHVIVGKSINGAQAYYSYFEESEIFKKD